MLEKYTFFCVINLDKQNRPLDFNAAHTEVHIVLLYLYVYLQYFVYLHTIHSDDWN